MSTPVVSTQPGASAVRAVSTPQKTPSVQFYKETVTLVTGAAKVQYTLHKGLLCFYSDFFRAALNGSFKEASVLLLRLRRRILAFRRLRPSHLQRRVLRWLLCAHLLSLVIVDVSSWLRIR
ncbi:hypothetical protein E4T44_02886 [Aureobasidium sp. EXF-8845]|nr:hypothetical protein E4T44_02886 [Aureobasidium sp. EXF-8845]KAI4855085.1 hypothetical protein E4T45_03482 [Aureobasidium sp. EXF-8846]